MKDDVRRLKKIKKRQQKVLKEKIHKSHEHIDKKELYTWGRVVSITIIALVVAIFVLLVILK